MEEETAMYQRNVNRNAGLAAEASDNNMQFEVPN